MKILVIRYSSIGDIILTTPVIRTLKTQLDADVHVATKVQFKSILENNPYIDRLHCLDQGLRTHLEELRGERFDVVIDLHNNLRTRMVKLALGVTSHSFRKLNIEKWLIVNFKINRLPDKHIVDRYLETVAPLGVKNDALGLDYFIPEKDEISSEWLPESHRGGYVVYGIGGQHFTKKLPINKMKELCERINRPIILVGGKEDQPAGEALKAHFDPGGTGNTSIYNACGIYNLNQSASLIKNARYVFSHDTGIMHIAAAFKKEIFTLWGNTIPAFGMTPYRTKFTIIENNRLSCRPCSKIGFAQCPRGHFKCMNDLKFDFYLP